MQKRKRILFVITGLKVGGAEVLVRDLALDFRREYEVMVACLAFPGEIYEQLRKEGVAVANLGLDSVFRFPSALVRYFRLLRRFHPDLVHTHMIHANLFGRLAKLVGIPVVSTVHVKLLDRPYLLWLDRATSFLVDRYVAVSGVVGEFIQKTRKIPDRKITVIDNGIPLSRFRNARVDRRALRQSIGVSSNRFVVGLVANLRPQKRHEDLLKAWSYVHKRYPDAKLVFVGTGQLEKDLKERAGRLQLQDSVLFLGQRSDVPQLLKSFDLFVLPSIFEGLPLSIVEAMAAGCPVIASDIPENRYVLEKARAGRLIPLRNPEALAQAINEAIGNPSSVPNRPDLRSFDWSRYLREHKKLYQEFL